MKVPGKTISNMEMAIKCFPMVQFIMATTSMASLKELESISGQMDNLMKGNGWMAWNMEVECGKVQKEIVMLENGEWEKLRAMESMSGLTEIVTKDNLNPVWNMDREHKNLPMVTFIKESTPKANRTDMVNIIGPMAAILKGTSKMGSEMVMVCGKRDLE